MCCFVVKKNNSGYNRYNQKHTMVCMIVPSDTGFWGVRNVAELLTGQLFINSEQVGSSVSVVLPNGGADEDFEEIQLHYLEAGIGEPMLLIHSLGQSLFTWRSVFSELSEYYRVIALDLPGHGYSSRPDTLSYSMDEMAEILAEFMNAKGIRSAHMIGFSMGAMYMLRFLTLYPGRVANCIAIAPGGITPDMPKLIRNMAKPIVNVFSRNLFSIADADRLLSECVADPMVIDDHMLEQYYEPISDGLSREGLSYALRNFDMDIVAEGLKKLDHEVLVVWGREDRWHLPEGSVYFREILRAGRYYLIRNVGHLVQEEAPEKLIDIVLGYIPSAVNDMARRAPAAQTEPEPFRPFDVPGAAEKEEPTAQTEPEPDGAEPVSDGEAKADEPDGAEAGETDAE